MAAAEENAQTFADTVERDLANREVDEAYTLSTDQLVHFQLTIAAGGPGGWIHLVYDKDMGRVDHGYIECVSPHRSFAPLPSDVAEGLWEKLGLDNEVI